MKETDVAAALAAGVELAGAKPRLIEVAHPEEEDLKILASLVNTPNGGATIQFAGDLQAELDKRRGGPHWRAGSTRLFEVDSFIEHIKRWGSDDTVVYADTIGLALIAVLDDHPAGEHSSETAWRQHRATYACPRSAEWKAWTERADKPMRQTEFGDWIEARLEDLVGAEGMPKPTDVLTVARQLTILTEGKFQRDINPTSGDSILVCKTETKSGSTQIPRAFMVAIPVFEGGDRYQLEARVRFALVDGVPSFSYTLHRAREIERDAFGEVRSKVAKETGRLVLAGTP